MVKYLLPLFGEKKFKQDNDGCTCLDLAINAKRGEVVGYLLQEGGFAKHLNQQQQVSPDHSVVRSIFLL